MTWRKLQQAAAYAIAAMSLTHAGLAQAPSAESVGVVSHLNVVSDKSEDLSTLEAWKRTYIRDGMSDQDKAIALFNTMVRYRHQANPPREFLSSGESGGHVHDPLKTIHVYGYGQCCCVAGQIVGLARYLGLDARGRNITAHSVCEVRYNDAWHLVDASVMNYHVKDDGQLASVDEIHQAVRDWFKDHPQHADLAGKDSALRKFAKNGGWKSGPPLLAKADAFYGEHGVNSAGWHGWPSTMQEYYKVGDEHEFGSTLGYQLNVQLRPGESITRNFFSRGREFTNNANEKYYSELLDRKRLGIQTTLGDKAPGRIGDGTLTWTVPMNDQQLARCALASDNLQTTAAGLGPADPATPASFVLRFPSSYVYVKGAAQLNALVAPGGAVAVSFSDNHGLDWTPLARLEHSGAHTLDLSPHILRRYDYRLKFELTGSGTALQALRTDADFQCSQAALPTITEGSNQITFSAGPQEGTITLEGSTDLNAAKTNGQLTLAAFKPVLNGIGENLRMTEGSGDATFTLDTPGDMTALRISAVWRARDPRDNFDVQVSYDQGSTFNSVAQLAGPAKGMTRYIVLRDVPPDTRQARVRFVGTQKNTASIFDLRIDADYREPHGGFTPIRIIYHWEEAGQPKQHVQIVDRPQQTYTITCGPDTLVKSYTLERLD